MKLAGNGVCKNISTSFGASVFVQDMQTAKNVSNGLNLNCADSCQFVQIKIGGNRFCLKLSATDLADDFRW